MGFLSLGRSRYSRGIRFQERVSHFVVKQIGRDASLEITERGSKNRLYAIIRIAQTRAVLLVCV